MAVTFTVSAAPTLAYVGQQLSIDVEAQNATSAYEYAVITYSNGTWSDPVWSSSSSLTVTQQPADASGYASIGVEVLDPSTGNIVFNKWLGQYPVFDPSTVTPVLDSLTQRLKISDVHSDVSQAASAMGWRAGITSFAGLQQYIETKFEASSPSETLPTQSTNVNRALYYMQWVSGMWAYGNLNNPNVPGNVFSNEITGTTDPTKATVQTYLQSPIADCVDFANVLSLTLTDAGIANRIVDMPGHTLNEAFLDGKWWALDANLDVAYAAPWASVVETGSTPQIYDFDDAGMIYGSTTYRPTLAQFFHYQMDAVAAGAFSFAYNYDPVTFLSTLPYKQLLYNSIQSTSWIGEGTGFQSPVAGIGSWAVGDFNGDGKSDALLYTPGVGGVKTYLSDGTQLVDSGTWTGTDSFGTWYVGDFDGDGKDDILSYQPGVSGAMVQLSTGSSFASPTSWTTAGNGTDGWYIGDFNGDGKDDIFSYQPGVSGAVVQLSTGSGFAPGVSWTGAGNGLSHWYVGDFNGDGKDDIAAQYSNGVEVFLSNGSSFVPDGIWTATLPADGGRWTVGDFDGDNKADLLSPSGELFTSNGSAFVDSGAWVTSESGMQTWTAGDFNGDGKSDVFTSYLQQSNAFIPVTANTGSLTPGQFTQLTAAAMQRLQLGEVHGTVSMNAAATAWRTGIDSFSQLASYVGTQFASLGSSESLPGIPTIAQEGMFFMQWVSGLWAYDGGTTDTPASVADYLQASTAGDQDYAAVLGALLTDIGIATSIVTVAGHELVQALLGTQWYTLDPTTDIAYQGSFDSVINTGTQPRAFAFDDDGTRSGSPVYSATLSNYIENTILAVANGSLFDYSVQATADYLDSLPDSSIFQTEPNPTGSFAPGTSWTGAGHGNQNWFLGDFDGDGTTDIMSYQPGISTALVQLSTGSGFSGTQTSWTNASEGSNGWTVGDFDGDGKDDIFSYQPGVSGAMVQLSTGSSFGTPASWTTAGNGYDGWYVGDFDGDGKDDVFSYLPGVSGAMMQLSNGSGFVSAGSWTGAGYGSMTWRVGDFNGDGKDDIAGSGQATGNGVEVYLSTGSGFVDDGLWTAANAGQGGWKVGNFNGDGKDDILTGTADGSGAEVYLSTGSHFLDSGKWANDNSGSDGRYVGDFNGDGRDDVFSYLPGVSGASVDLSKS